MWYHNREKDLNPRIPASLRPVFVEGTGEYQGSNEAPIGQQQVNLPIADENFFILPDPPSGAEQEIGLIDDIASFPSNDATSDEDLYDYTLFSDPAGNNNLDQPVTNIFTTEDQGNDGAFPNSLSFAQSQWDQNSASPLLAIRPRSLHPDGNVGKVLRLRQRA